MIGKHFGEKKCSSRGMYIRSSSDILPKWEDMRTKFGYTTLSEIVAKVYFHLRW
jgi:hypothetical protein